MTGKAKKKVVAKTIYRFSVVGKPKDGTTGAMAGEEKNSLTRNQTESSNNAIDDIVQRTISTDVAGTTATNSEQESDKRQTTVDGKQEVQGQESDQEYDTTRPRAITIRATVIHEPKHN